MQDTPELKDLCSAVTSEQAFIQALAEHFLKEPALSARRETYENLGLPPPDETGTLPLAKPPMRTLGLLTVSSPRIYRGRRWVAHFSDRRKVSEMQQSFRSLTGALRPLQLPSYNI